VGIPQQVWRRGVVDQFEERRKGVAQAYAMAGGRFQIVFADGVGHFRSLQVDEGPPTP